ncbi:unnamed protein product [Discosporangium mesarthrocarpum]
MASHRRNPIPLTIPRFSTGNARVGVVGARGRHRWAKVQVEGPWEKTGEEYDHHWEEGGGLVVQGLELGDGGVESNVGEGGRRGNKGGPSSSKGPLGERRTRRLPPIDVALKEATDCTRLGDMWFKRGCLEPARREHLRALGVRLARLPAGHPDISQSLESLGNVAIRAGRHREAEGLHRRALEMRVTRLGPNHIDVAATLNNLAVALKGQPGKMDEAMAVCQRAVSIAESKDAVGGAVGEENPALAAALPRLLESILRKQGRDVEAEALRLRAKNMEQGLLSST